MWWLRLWQVFRLASFVSLVDWVRNKLGLRNPAWSPFVLIVISVGIIFFIYRVLGKKIVIK
jgi:hypothetical protein